MKTTDNSKAAPSGHGAKATPYPAPVIVEPKASHKQSLIFLHGRGGTGSEFEKGLLRSHTTLPSQDKAPPTTLEDHFPHMRFIFPTAKRRRARYYHKGFVLNQWFDNVPIDEQDSHGVSKEEEERQLEGLRESRAYVMAIVEEEVRSVGAANVFLGGLSQDCAMSLHVLLSYEGFSHDAAPLGGYIGMSGWLPFLKTVHAIVHPGKVTQVGLNDGDLPSASDNDDTEDGTHSSRLDNRSEPATAAQVCNFVRGNLELPSIRTPEPLCAKIPVLLGHGRRDTRVLLTKGMQTAAGLRDLGMTVTWKDYDEGHWYKVPEQNQCYGNVLASTAIGWCCSCIAIGAEVERDVQMLDRRGCLGSAKFILPQTCSSQA